ncbi:pentapeptide repeat-containing protein [Amycolatopsis sp. cmx-8-4]|uniref:pentapeptide repeat-containing protein n=1 Tax=Amycolatopsis sp. cmx-8-4 TaxID=2790947 RepID=UPI0039787AC4
MNRVVLRTVLAVAALAIAGGVLWFLFDPVVGWLGGADLDRLDVKDRIAAVGTIRGQVATVLSAAFVAGGLYYTGRKFVLDRDKQYTDRFTNAVDQLGSTDVTVRAGGLRALDRILHDSPRDRDRVLRTVTGYLRAHPVTDAIPDDVVAALATLRDRAKPPRGQRDVLDLRGITLPRADLTGFDLRDADLTGGDLTGTVLRDADLRGARMNRTTVREADLTGAKLAGVFAVKAVLAHSTIHEADLEGSDLTDADLSECDLSDARLDGAVLVNTALDGADLRTARGLTEDQLRRTRRSAATSLPPDLG